MKINRETITAFLCLALYYAVVLGFLAVLFPITWVCGVFAGDEGEEE